MYLYNWRPGRMIRPYVGTAFVQSPSTIATLISAPFRSSCPVQSSEVGKAVDPMTL